MHLLLVALLVIPTKHQHLVAGPINLAFMRTRPRGQMLKMDLEELKDQLNALQEMLREAQERSPFKPAERRKVTRPDTTSAPPPPSAPGAGGETVAVAVEHHERIQIPRPSLPRVSKDPDGE